MKHIRLFEEFDDNEDDESIEHYTTQDVGDYIKLNTDDNSDDNYNHEWTIIGPFCKIIEVNAGDFDESENEMYEPRYNIIGIDKKTKGTIYFWIGESEIDRYLTSEEIEEFELLLNVNKFNI